MLFSDDPEEVEDPLVERIQQWDKKHAGKGKAPITSKDKTKYKILESNFTCDSVMSPKFSGNVYWAVFAGRRDRLEVQEKYWHFLHNAGLITEVHLWDFTANRGSKEEGKLNKEWLKKKAQEHNFVKVMTKAEGKFSFRDFYSHYADNLTAADVLVKADDDILWVNVSEFKCFVKYVHANTDEVLVNANVVNNAVTAHIQQKLGIIPKSVGDFEYPLGGRAGTLYHSPEKALALHKYFLSHKEIFFKDMIIQYMERMSINLFGVNYINAKIAFEITEYAYRHHQYFKGALDEIALTAFANVHLQTKQVVYMRLVVAHGTFVQQWRRSIKITSQITELYKKEGLT